MAPKPGILFANARISDPILDAETFRRWYEEVHVPDVLATSGVHTAFRFQNPDSEDTERPYLAIYPFNDLEWLATGEFFRVPLTSDILPNPSKRILEVTDFDIRFYETLQVKPGSGRPGPADSIVAVTFDTDETDATKILLQGLVQGPQPSRSTLLQISHQYQPPRDPSSLRIPDYLVLHEYAVIPEQITVADHAVRVVKFEFLRSFGKETSKW